MKTQKYAINQYPAKTFFVWVQSGEIAIPEIAFNPLQIPKTKSRLIAGFMNGQVKVGDVKGYEENGDVRMAAEPEGESDM